MKKILIKITIFMILIITILLVIINNIPDRNIVIQQIKKMEYNLLNEETRVGITYYISEDGKSEDGKDVNNPMSLEIANNKIFYAGDKVLFKCGDIFYGNINFKVKERENQMIYIGNYGEGEKPIISGERILINEMAWEEEKNNIYKVDLSIEENFSGIDSKIMDIYNIGFIIDKNDNIYGKRTKTLEELENDFDFFCDNRYLYVKYSQNDIEKLSGLRFTGKNYLVNLYSNTIISGINIKNTGAHGVVKKSYPIKMYIYIIVFFENIGGSVGNQETFSRYGNAIEFWLDAENIIIEKNIIRNSYDAGITLQGNSGKWSNIFLNDNILIRNCYSFELWGSNEAIGMDNVKIYNNICINQGGGWAQEVRHNPYNSAEFVFYGYGKETAIDIDIYNNRYYNSFRMYYILNSIKDKFKENIQVINNEYRIRKEIYIVNDNIKDKPKEYLNEEYNIEQNSTFRIISDNEIQQISNPEILNSNDYNEIKTYYENLEKEFEYNDIKKEVLREYSNFRNNNAEIISKINNCSTKLLQIEKQIQNSTSSSINQEFLKQLIDKNYTIVDDIKTQYQLKNITDEEILTMLQALNKLGQSCDTIYEKFDIRNTSVSNNLNEQIQQAEQSINNNRDLNIEDISNILDLIKKIYNNGETYNNSIAITKYIELINQEIGKRIHKYIADNPVTISYSQTNLTNQDVKATITTNANIEITNNSNSKEHKFTENGNFIFEYTIKGQAFTIEAKVNNIDKIAPKIEGIGQGKIYNDKVRPQISDDNLQEVKLLSNGQVVADYEVNSEIKGEGIYQLIATDKAGNKTQVDFQIIEPTEEDYKIEGSVIKNINNNTKKSEFAKKLIIGEEYDIMREKEIITEEQIIATGDILKTKSGKEYTLIVTGDINKDGDVNIKDVVKLRTYLLMRNNLDEIEIMAADTNLDEKVIGIKDLVKMRIILLTKGIMK